MLAARFELVPYLDHDGLVGDLLKWCHSDSGKGLALSVLAGPGGAGKTRTAVRLCEELSVRHWMARMLMDGGEDDAPGLANLAAFRGARLVVVDGARTPPEGLATILSSLAEHATAEAPARVVFIARSAWATEDRATSHGEGGHALDALMQGARLDMLADHPMAGLARRRLYVSAYRAFAGFLSRPAVPAEPPAELDELLFANPLMTVIAAYLGVHSETPAVTAPALLERLLDHEDRYWHRIAVGREPPLQLDKLLRRRVAALACLAAAGDEAEAVRVAGLIDETPSAEHRQQLAGWAAALYAGPRHWNRPEPDLVAQHLVVSTFRQDQGLLGGVLSAPIPAELTRPVGLLARAVFSDPEYAEPVRLAFNRQLPYLCRQALAQATSHPDGGRRTSDDLAAALTDLVHVCPPDPGLLPRVLDALPSDVNGSFGSLCLALTRQLVTYYRGLAGTDPATYQPLLAIALNNLSVRLGDVARYDQATGTVNDALTYFRRLAAADREAYLPDLAITLRNLSLWLTASGRREEARAATSEAVGHYRTLAADHAATHSPNLAASLHALSLHLAALGRHEEARAAAAEAVAQYRDLAKANPTRYVPRLAESLQNLSLRLVDLSLRKDAAATRKEAAALLRTPRRRRRVAIPRGSARG